ncbi:hypothetical protein ACA910_009944 [Epithemia clementina (nom. ined.)]
MEEVNGSSPSSSSSSSSSSSTLSSSSSSRQEKAEERPTPRFAVSASELEKDLQAEERTAVRVVRQAGPSVAFVTSVWPTATTNDEDSSSSSGSAFVVDPDGYLVTNYHVIESAYQMQRMDQQMKMAWQQLWGNLTTATFPSSSSSSSSQQEDDSSPRSFLFDFWQNSQSILPAPIRQIWNRPPPIVYIRLTDTQFRKCRIVHVQPDLDLAVLQINDDENKNNKKDDEMFPSVAFGSSSNLLVGQGLIAIGNPFGLDNSVTTGVVSALNRELRAGRRNGPVLAAAQSPTPIRNCIQTDCAINPGNSGGPLLNSQGQVVGVNTAIVSTTGSFSGIGFAVPSDAVQPVVERIIRNDKISNPRRRSSSSSAIPWLGVRIVQIRPMRLDTARRDVTEAATVEAKDNNLRVEDYDQSIRRYVENENWIRTVAPNSPAARAGMRGLQLNPDRGTVDFGDAIVAIGGNAIRTFAELQAELAQRKVGEQVAVTLEDGRTGERRVVYLVLTEQPNKNQKQ